MTDRIRFHLDENVDPAVAGGLRRRGVDVTTSQETGLLNSSDDRQIDFARTEHRVLVTHDEGFLSRAKHGVEHVGIVYCHPEARSIGQMIAAVMLIYDCLTPDDMRNHVEFL
jgi:predicted nuclease of predicted toxin-antitoxin system